LPAPFSETPPGAELMHALDLNGEKGSAGATFIVVTPLDAGDFTIEGECLAASLGKDRRYNLTRGSDPKP